MKATNECAQSDLCLSLASTYFEFWEEVSYFLYED